MLCAKFVNFGNDCFCCSTTKRGYHITYPVQRDQGPWKEVISQKNIIFSSAWSGLKFLGLGRAQTQKFRARALSGFSNLEISGLNGLGLSNNVKCGLFGLSGLEKSQFFFKKLKKKISSEITTTNFSQYFGQVCQFCETKSLSYNFEMF